MKYRVTNVSTLPFPGAGSVPKLGPGASAEIEIGEAKAESLARNGVLRFEPVRAAPRKQQKAREQMPSDVSKTSSAAVMAPQAPEKETV